MFFYLKIYGKINSEFLMLADELAKAKTEKTNQQNATTGRVAFFY